MFLFFSIPSIALDAGMPVNKRVIAIDAGHGEWDPGKQNRSVDEKDINLAVSEKLQTLFELGGAVVFTTRSDDTALADRKRDDLTARAKIANQAEADIYISIHQNSFNSPSVYGAQVFYHKSSEKSKILAEMIQARMNAFMGDHDYLSDRQAKSSEVYFVLKKTDMPAVIVECGFMSNLRELGLLQDEDFQEKIAWAIYMGVMDYFGKTDVCEPDKDGVNRGVK
jgi:N-acetylmuramoyl-L-alanine amidase